MLHRRILAGRSRPARMLLALIATSACLGAVALAATRVGVGKAASDADARGAGKKAPGGKQRQGRPPGPPRPRFIEVAAAPSIGPRARFRFHLTPRVTNPRPPAPAGD